MGPLPAGAAAAALVLSLGVAALIVSVRIGILLGLRLDRAMERRASRDGGAGEEVVGDD